MAAINVKVRTPKNVRVQVKAPTAISASIRRITLTNTNLEHLINVNEFAYGLQDGFTVVYDVATRTWKTRHITTVINEAVDLDGGIY